VIALVEAQGIGPARPGAARFVSVPAMASPALARDPDGACVFLEPGPRGLCSIHRHAGPGALPSACRHFPRTVLSDGRGTFFSLSHYCPTAAMLLFDSAPLTIVEAAPPLKIDAPEGLEARGVLPPLERTGPR
jgi:hypothetical protein